MAHQSLTSTSSPILKDFVLENPRVLKYVDINAVEENVQVHDSPLSVATSHKVSSTSDSSSSSSAVASSSQISNSSMSVSSSPFSTP
jgi:hypothetical protein